MADIDYGKILSRSFEITKKNKWLWIYGLVLAITTGSSFSGGGGGGSGGGDLDKLKNLLKNLDVPKEVPQDLPEKAANVLGQSTIAIKEWLANVSPATWVMLVLGILAVILIWVLVSWIIQSWGKAGLIYGLNSASDEKQVKLPETSGYGISKIRLMILYCLISVAVAIVTLTIAAIITASGFLLLNFARAFIFFWLIGCIVIIGGSLLVLFMIYAMIGVYAERLIVLYSYTPWKAWKKAFILSKSNFLPTLSMGVINMSVGCSFGCLANIVLLLILGIPALLLLLPSFKNGFHFPNPPTLGILFVLFMFFIWLNYVIRAILVVFNYSNWNLFFREIISKEGNV